MHVLLLALTLASSPQRSDTAYFLTRLGRDTLAVERFTFDGHVLDGVSVRRSPRVMVRVYHGFFAPDGRPQTLVIQSGPVGKPSTQTTDLRYSDDSVTIETRRDTTVRHHSFAAPGRPVPYSPDVIGPWAMALQTALNGATGEVSMPIFAGGGAQVYHIQRSTGDTFDLGIADPDYGPLRAGMDDGGRLAFLDFRATTDKYLARRVDHLAVDSLTAVFAARELAGAGMGMLSPRDTAWGTIGDAHVMVDYGRPSMRGRAVFGGIVPWDTVWRTGANEATQLIADRDVVIGGTPVPAGTYSLFTIPSATGWRLIVNKQHGQWGTVYDSTQDLARIPMRVHQAATPMERLEISVGDSGLVIAWADTEAEVEVKSH